MELKEKKILNPKFCLVVGGAVAVQRKREREREREMSDGERREVREKKYKIMICTVLYPLM